MGWTGEYNVPRTYAEEKARIEKMFTWSNEPEGCSHRVVKVCNVRPNWYVAIEVVAPATHEDSTYEAETLPDGRKRYTFGVVVLCKRYSNEWCHKEIEESSGPNESEAPASFLAILSPLKAAPNDDCPTQWAHNWRARCAANAAAKSKAKGVKAGEVIRFAAPLSFGGYGMAQEFTATENPAIFYAKELHGMRVQLRPRTLQHHAWERVPA